MEQMRYNIAFSLERAAQNYPNQTAVVVPHTGTSISFAELNDESSRIASGINQYGLKKAIVSYSLFPLVLNLSLSPSHCLKLAQYLSLLILDWGAKIF